MVAQRPVNAAERRRRVILLDRIDKALTLDLGTEVIRMGLDSVVTVVGTRNDHRKHLSLRSSERRVAPHGGHVEIEHGLEGGRVLALDFKDVVDPPGAFPGGVVDAREQAVSLVFGDDVNECHVDSSLCRVKRPAQSRTETVEWFSTR